MKITDDEQETWLSCAVRFFIYTAIAATVGFFTAIAILSFKGGF